MLLTIYKDDFEFKTEQIKTQRTERQKKRFYKRIGRKCRLI